MHNTYALEVKKRGSEKVKLDNIKQRGICGSCNHNPSVAGEMCCIETFPIVRHVSTLNSSYGREEFMDNKTGIYIIQFLLVGIWFFSIKLGNICQIFIVFLFNYEKKDFMISSMTQKLRHTFVKFQIYINNISISGYPPPNRAGSVIILLCYSKTFKPKFINMKYLCF